MTETENTTSIAEYQYQFTHIFVGKNGVKRILDISNQAILKMIAGQDDQVKLTTGKCKSGDVCQRIGQRKEKAVLLGTGNSGIYYLMNDGTIDYWTSECWVAVGETRKIDWHFVFNPTSSLVSNPKTLFDARPEAFAEMTSVELFKKFRSGQVVAAATSVVKNLQVVSLRIVVGMVGYNRLACLDFLDRTQFRFWDNENHVFLTDLPDVKLEFCNPEPTSCCILPICTPPKEPPIELHYPQGSSIGYDIRPEAFQELKDVEFHNLRSGQRFFNSSTEQIWTIIGVDKTNAIDQVNYSISFEKNTSVSLLKSDLPKLILLSTLGKIEWQPTASGKRKAQDTLKNSDEKSAKIN